MLRLDPKFARDLQRIVIGQIRGPPIKPDYALGSHVAPLAVTRDDAAQVPAAYRGGMFVSEHGSWDRSPVSGFRREAHARPAGGTRDKAGALLIADDVGITVWRVSGTQQTALR